MISVGEIRPAETASLDHARIVEIAERLGPGGADDFLCRAMEEIAVLLGEAERAYEAGHPVQLRAAAAQIAGHAASIGMSTLENAAGNMVDVARSNPSGAALAAVCYRMLRIGEQSFMALWELGDVSM